MVLVEGAISRDLSGYRRSIRRVERAMKEVVHEKRSGVL